MILSKDCDISGMFSFLTGFGQQWKDALQANKYRDFSIVKNRDVSRIFIAGMGGSAIAGEIVVRWSAENLMTSVQVIRDYEVRNLQTNDMVICTSYSGNTEETLSVFTQAKKIGTPIVGISSGGKLQNFCEQSNIPYFQIPSGFAPRAALGHSLVTLAGILVRIVPDFIQLYQKLGSAIEMIEENIFQWSNLNNTDNLAVEIAKFFGAGIPIIYTEAGLWESVGTRWRGQISENAIVLAYSSAIPEMNHNEIVGYDTTNDHKMQFRSLIIKTENTHPRIVARMNFMEKMLGSQGKLITISGQHPFLALLSSFQLADFVSFYLAIIRRVDPSPVVIIEALKKELAKKTFLL